MVVKPYAMSACALFIIGMTSRWRRGRGRHAAAATIGGGAGARQPPKTRAADVADARRRRRRRRRPRSARSARSARRADATSSVARQPLDDVDVPFVRRPYGCPSGYSSAISASTARTAGLSSSCRIAVMTSPLRVAKLRLRQRRRHDDVAEQRQHRLEVLGQAGADEREQVARDGDRQRDAAAVELFGDIGRRTRRRAAIDDARQQIRRARRVRPDRRSSRRGSPG